MPVAPRRQHPQPHPPSPGLRCRLQPRPIRPFIGRTGSPRGHQPRLRSQPARQQPCLRHVLPPQQPAGQQPYRGPLPHRLVQPCPCPPYRGARRPVARLHQIRQPAASHSRMPPQYRRVRPVDGGMTHPRRTRKHRPGRRSQRPESRSPDLRPTPPSLVKPPVVMMRHQRDPHPIACRHQRLRHRKIPPQPQIVRPYHHPPAPPLHLPRRFPQQSPPHRSKPAAKPVRRSSLFRPVPKHPVHPESHRNPPHRRLQSLHPVRIPRLARRHRHPSSPLPRTATAPLPHQMG